MEKVDYLEFVKKLDEIENYQEKVNLVNNILNHNITLDLEMATVALAIDDLSDLVDISEEDLQKKREVSIS